MWRQPRYHYFYVMRFRLKRTLQVIAVCTCVLVYINFFLVNKSGLSSFGLGFGSGAVDRSAQNFGGKKSDFFLLHLEGVSWLFVFIYFNLLSLISFPWNRPFFLYTVRPRSLTAFNLQTYYKFIRLWLSYVSNFFTNFVHQYVFFSLFCLKVT